MKIECYFRTKRRDPLLRKIAGICRELGYGIDMEETMLHIYPCPLAELAIGWRRKNILLSSQWELARRGRDCTRLWQSCWTASARRT